LAGDQIREEGHRRRAPLLLFSLPPRLIAENSVSPPCGAANHHIFLICS
jgi:hypothetical protein